MAISYKRKMFVKVTFGVTPKAIHLSHPRGTLTKGEGSVQLTSLYFLA
jgi:hypothetical protein